MWLAGHGTQACSSSSDRVELRPACRLRKVGRQVKFLKKQAGSIDLRPYSWTPLCRTRLSRTPCYLEQNRISLGFALGFFFSFIYYGPARTRLSRTPRYLPGYLEPYYGPKKDWSTSDRKCSQGTSWQDVLKAEKCIHVFTVTKAKSDWLDLPLRMQKATSCRYLLILGIKLLLQKFDANLSNLEHPTPPPPPPPPPPPVSRTISRYPWEFEIAGFYGQSTLKVAVVARVRHRNRTRDVTDCDKPQKCRPSSPQSNDMWRHRQRGTHMWRLMFLPFLLQSRASSSEVWTPAPGFLLHGTSANLSAAHAQCERGLWTADRGSRL